MIFIHQVIKHVMSAHVSIKPWVINNKKNIKLYECLYVDTSLYLPNEAAGCDSSGCQAVTFTSCAMGEDVPTLQGTADYLVWVKGKISNRNTFIIAARILQNMR